MLSFLDRYRDLAPLGGLFFLLYGAPRYSLDAVLARRRAPGYSK